MAMICPLTNEELIAIHPVVYLDGVRVIPPPRPTVTRYIYHSLHTETRELVPDTLLGYFDASGRLLATSYHGHMPPDEQSGVPAAKRGPMLPLSQKPSTPHVICSDEMIRMGG
jgi:hypothetical protein